MQVTWYISFVGTFKKKIPYVISIDWFSCSVMVGRKAGRRGEKQSVRETRIITDDFPVSSSEAC